MSQPEYPSPGKSLFRDIHRKVFSGVCSGLALYLNIDPVIIRILFAVIFYFWHPVILIYVLLWIAMPVPRTPSQWLEMKGGADYFKYKGKSAKGSDSKAYSTVTPRYDSYYHRDVVSQGLRSTSEVISFILGLFLAILSFMGLISLVTFLLFQNSPLGEIIPESRFIYELPHRFLLPDDLSMASLAIGIMGGIPLLAIFYLALKLIFKFPAKGLTVGLIALLVWFAGLGLFFYQGIDFLKSFKTIATIETEKELSTVTSQILILSGEMS